MPPGRASMFGEAGADGSAAMMSGALGVGQIVDRAIRLARQHFRMLAVIAGFLAAANFLVGLLDLVGPAVAPAPRQPLTDDDVLGDLGRTGPVLLVQTIIGMFVYGIGWLAFIHQYFAVLHGRVVARRESIRQALRRCHLALVMQIVQLFIVALLTLPMLIPVIIITIIVVLVVGPTTDLGPLLRGDDTSPQLVGRFVLAGGLLVVAVLILLIPFAYCYTRWLVAAPSLLVEGHGGVRSLRRSWQLSRGSVRHCLGLWLLLICLWTLVNLIPFLLLHQGVLLVFGPTATELARMVTNAFSSLTVIVWLPFEVAVTTLLYIDLRVRREGYDLSLRVVALEQEAQLDSSTAGREVG